VLGGASVSVLMGLADPAGRSPNSDTCPFFRSIDETGAIRTPFEVPHDANRCMAVADPTPQSVRQQELVCLTAGHVNCPRYLRGALVSSQTARRGPRRSMASPPVIAAVLVLVLAAAASVGFLFARGGLALALPSPTPSQVAVASSSPTPEPTIVAPTTSPSPSPVPPSPSLSPTPSPSPARTAAPTAIATPTPAPTSDRYAVLVACPDAPDCWIYIVRAGDNFQSIVNWFGVPYDTVARMNPQLGDLATLHVGDKIRMPPPTR
jgi:LysM repeat protein